MKAFLIDMIAKTKGGRLGMCKQLLLLSHGDWCDNTTYMKLSFKSQINFVTFAIQKQV